MDFGNAFKMITSGSKMSRVEWDDPEDIITFDEEKNRLTRKIPVSTNSSEKTEVAWIPNTQDLMARDWEIMR